MPTHDQPISPASILFLKSPVSNDLAAAEEVAEPLLAATLVLLIEQDQPVLLIMVDLHFIDGLAGPQQVRRPGLTATLVRYEWALRVLVRLVDSRFLGHFGGSF